MLLMLIASLLLQACTAVRLGYGNADSLTRWWLDQYLDLSPEQDVLARERLARLHAWHRRTQLPDYITVLRQGQSFIAGQPKAADALVLLDSAANRSRTLAQQALPDIADFLATVKPEQIERMAAHLTEKNADFAREAQLTANESAQRKARFQRTLERAEDWFGDFSSEQRTALRRIVDGQPAGSQFWFEERLRRQREWLDLVRQVQRERPPRARIVQLLHDYIARFDLPADPARLAQAVALRQASAELVVAILVMTSPEQRTHARLKLDDLIHDLSELSRPDPVAADFESGAGGVKRGGPS
jgi:hypothetical protein